MGRTVVLTSWCSAIPEIDAKDVVLISDRDKGLAAADSVLNLTRRATAVSILRTIYRLNLVLLTGRSFGSSLMLDWSYYTIML